MLLLRVISTETACPVRMLPARLAPARKMLAALVTLLCAIGGQQQALAAGGTATPPAPGLGTPSPIATTPPPVPEIAFSAPLDDIKAFRLVGFLQNATVSGADCQPGTLPIQFGGTAVVNDILVTVPCNTTLQMPAATFKWAELFDARKFASTQKPPASLTLPAVAATTSSAKFAYPSIEMTIVGNIVAGRYIAGLIYISQQSLNTSTGYVTGIQYAAGALLIANSPDGKPTTRIQINDVNGRFTIGQAPDSRFGVDDTNPTIRSATGYPMCVPRTAPGVADDPLCPKRNRPHVAAGCRNFAAAGITLPTGRDMAPPVAGQEFCSAFVMGTPATALPSEPDATQQAPFAIGDFITYSGTLLRGDGKGPDGSDTISVHTIVASVGIYTQPGTLPAYLAIGEFGVSADAPLVFNGVPQEAPDRLVLEAFVTDVTSVVDIYFVDLDPVNGRETQRWLTQQSMTGGFGSLSANGIFVGGGISTQFTGPVPGRVRIRAGKATPGVLASPTRYMRVVARSLCDPINVNAKATLLGSNPPVKVPCLQRAPAANGLYAGQYLAPTFDYLFPENVVPGDPVAPNNFWDLGFLVNGEGPRTGRLSPTPW